MHVATNTNAILSSQPPAIRATNATQETANVADTRNRQSARPAFLSNGLMDTQGLLSSGLVREVITLTAGGSLGFKDPNRLLTSQEHMARQEIASQAGELLTDGAPPANQLLSDDDKAFFRATTGYNFVTFANGAHMVVDDEGNPPKVSNKELDAMGTLGISLMGDRSSGRLDGGVTNGWFQDFMRTYAGSDLSAPESWKTRAEDWFLKPSEEA